MTISTLRETVTKTQQEKLASLLGVTQGAISQAYQNERNIFIIKDDNGVSAFEIKAVFKSNPDINAISEKLLQLEPA